MSLNRAYRRNIWQDQANNGESGGGMLIEAFAQPQYTADTDDDDEWWYPPQFIILSRHFCLAHLHYYKEELKGGLFWLRS